MALKALLDSLNGLPESLAAHYTKRDDGKYILTVEEVDGYAFENITGLKRALSMARENETAAKRALEGYKGIDDVEAAKEALAKLRAGDLKSPAELDAYKKSLESKFQKDLSAAAERAQAYEAQLKDLRFGTMARDAIIKAKGRASLLLPIVERRVKWEADSNGQLQLRVVGEDGKTLVSNKPGSADPMGLEEYVHSLRSNADFAAAFEPTAPAGSGSNHAAGGTVRMGDNQPKLSPEARLAAIAEATTVVR
jgi:hypothetical protein